MDSPPTIANKSKEYTLISEAKSFKIKISLSSNIIIEVNELEKIKGIFYSNTFSLEALVKLSRGFKICEDINEAYDIIEQIFENKKSTIKYLNENELLLIIKVDLPGGKIQEVNLTLNKKEMNKNLLIEELILKVNQLEEENKNLKKDINEMKEKLNRFEKYFAEEIEEKKFFEKIGFESKIIKNKDEIKFITNRLVNNDENLRKKIKYNLIYRATRDGDTSTNFHNKVDNKNSLLSIIETNKGLKFGVFTEQPYKKTENSIKDNKVFIYSLNLKKIYNSKEGVYTNNDLSDYLINLYYQPICICDNCLSNKSSYTCSKSYADYSFLGFEKDYELNNNEQYFQVKEMETFQITFNLKKELKLNLIYLKNSINFRL